MMTMMTMTKEGKKSRSSVTCITYSPQASLTTRGTLFQMKINIISVMTMKKINQYKTDFTFQSLLDLVLMIMMRMISASDGDNIDYDGMTTMILTSQWLKVGVFMGLGSKYDDDDGDDEDSDQTR